MINQYIIYRTANQLPLDEILSDENKAYLSVTHVDQKQVSSRFLTLKIMLISAKVVT